MANTIETNGIVIQVPTATDPGPGAQALVTNGLVTICAHTHDGVEDGASINIAGQVIANDLSLDGYNLSNVQSVEFLSQPSVLSGSQAVNTVYVNQNNLGFNNSNGVFVPITDGNTLAITTFPFTNFSSRNVSSNFTILNTDTYNLINVDTSGGAITGTLPIAATISPTPAGRLFIFKDISGHALVNNITIQVSSGSGNTFGNIGGATSILINNTYGYVALYTDGISQWFMWDADVLNGEILQLNGSLLNSNASRIALDSASSMVVSGGEISTSAATVTLSAATTMNVNASTLNVLNDSSVIVSGGSAVEMQTGTLTTLDAGSYLALNGEIAASATIAGTLTGTLNLPGTTNLNGAANLSGTGNSITGTVSVSGEVLVQNTGTIQVSAGGHITNTGISLTYGTVMATTLLSPGTYQVDSGPNLDYFIGIDGTSGTWNISMPASPEVGRVLVFSNVIPAQPATFSITWNGFGHNIVGGSTFVLALSDYGGGGSINFWSITFLFVNNQWIAINALNVVGL